MGKRKQIAALQAQVASLEKAHKDIWDFLLLAPEEQEAKVKRILQTREVIKKFQESMENAMLLGPAFDAALKEDIAFAGLSPGHRTTVRTGFPGRTWDTLHKPGPGDNIEIPPIPAEIQADKDNADLNEVQHG